jgi:hypothetical protein
MRQYPGMFCFSSEIYWCLELYWWKPEYVWRLKTSGIWHCANWWIGNYAVDDLAPSVLRVWTVFLDYSDLEDGGSKLIQNTGYCLPVDMMSQHTRLEFFTTTAVIATVLAVYAFLAGCKQIQLWSWPVQMLKITGSVFARLNFWNRSPSVLCMHVWLLSRLSCACICNSSHTYLVYAYMNAVSHWFVGSLNFSVPVTLHWIYEQ